MTTQFSPAVVQKLGYYVYIYINPLDDIVFYVGKGKGNRAFTHLDDPGPSERATMIKDIRAAKLEPKVEILVHGLKDEKTALKIEAAIIDLLGKGKLTNKILGYHSKSHGRMTIEQVTALYDAVPVTIVDPVILIRISRMYRHTMSPLEIYEATRAYWKVGSRREKVKLALAVHAGVVREVYEIAAWFQAQTTFLNRPHTKVHDPKRFEFVGRIAQDDIRTKYLQKSVSHYLPKSAQNPIQYVIP